MSVRESRGVSVKTSKWNEYAFGEPKKTGSPFFINFKKDFFFKDFLKSSVLY